MKSPIGTNWEGVIRVIRLRKKVVGVRERALEVLLKIDSGQVGSRAAINEYSGGLSDSRDRHLLQAIVLGVQRHRLLLDWMIGRFLRTPEVTSPEILQVLRIGLFQSWFLERIPAFALVNESVELAKKRVSTKTGALVNAIMRKLAGTSRESSLKELDPSSDRDRSVLDSHPEWLIHRWRNLLNRERFDRILSQNNSIPPHFLRRSSFEAWRPLWDELTRIPASWVQVQGIPSAYRLVSDHAEVRPSIVHAAEIFSQDLHAQWAVQQLGVEPGMRILDACSGRGGKVLWMLDRLNSIQPSSLRSEILAVDLQPDKLIRLRGNLKTILSENPAFTVSVLCWDLLSALPRIEGRYDRIFLDVPCTNLGVIRRHPEIRWRIRSDDIWRSARRQRRLLENVVRYLAPGGELIYCACTFEPEEGLSLVTSWLTGAHELIPVPLAPPDYPGCDADVSVEGFVTLYPVAEGGDGFFVAKVRRK
jgi:16S rRNA (cytosine967-C5)-methyltransferase